ncbi:sensor histidine kinase [Paenibacillus sp. GCM10027626]|uniref:cache domain-containing sensor histidine kinase n=1 Tax=Paenibacillus sp. GCM10027626 TaxID=3273411 RepID=UPI0036451AA3
MRWSLKRKLLVVIVISLFLPFLLLGYLWYSRTEQTIEHNAASYSRLLLEQMNRSIDSYVSELDQLAIPFLLNPAIQSFLHLKPDDYYGQFQLEKKIRSELYKNLYSSRNDIYKFTLIMNENLYLSSQDFVLDERNRSYLKLLDLDDPVTDFTIEGVNRISGIPVITAYKVIYDPMDRRNKGILIVDLKLNRIAEMISGLKLDGVGRAYLVNNGGQYIYHPESSLIGSITEDTLMNEVIRGDGGDRGGFVTRGSGAGRTMIGFQTSELTNWTILFEVPMKFLTAELVQMRTMAFILFGCIAVVAMLLLGSFTFYLIRSLSLIQRLMRRAEEGNLNVRAPAKSKDEIGMLYLSFNTMMDEYRRLIHVEHFSQLKEKEMQVRQKEAVLTALQSQINPHFLYNTLGTIHSYAILAGVQPISRMVSNLSDIFRYSMDSDKQVVSLWNEIRYIDTYFDLQKERHEELHTEIQVEEDARLKEIPCIKLMLQPLVENALIHGYQDQELPPEYIGIIGQLGSDGYEIRVIDKGRGMDTEVQTHFNQLFLKLTHDNLLQGDRRIVGRSIGLYNVHKRLRLVYGEPYGLWIEETGAGGTTIRVLVPAGNKAG